MGRLRGLADVRRHASARIFAPLLQSFKRAHRNGLVQFVAAAVQQMMPLVGDLRTEGFEERRMRPIGSGQRANDQHF
jgi:hypothetical protein